MNVYDSAHVAGHQQLPVVAKDFGGQDNLFMFLEQSTTSSAGTP
jgi:hypothetical protein